MTLTPERRAEIEEWFGRKATINSGVYGRELLAALAKAEREIERLKVYETEQELARRLAEAERERDELRERFETERRRAIQAETALIARGE